MHRVSQDNYGRNLIPWFTISSKIWSKEVRVIECSWIVIQMGYIVIFFITFLLRCFRVWNLEEIEERYMGRYVKNSLVCYNLGNMFYGI